MYVARDKVACDDKQLWPGTRPSTPGYTSKGATKHRFNCSCANLLMQKFYDLGRLAAHLTTLTKAFVLFRVLPASRLKSINETIEQRVVYATRYLFPALPSMVSGFISVRLQLGSAGDWVGRCNFRAVLTNRCFPGRLLRVFFRCFSLRTQASTGRKHIAH